MLEMVSCGKAVGVLEMVLWKMAVGDGEKDGALREGSGCSGGGALRDGRVCRRWSRSGSRGQGSGGVGETLIRAVAGVMMT